MTAQRGWVRVIARWLARVDGVSSMIRLVMLGLTGISTATLTLQQYGHGQYAWPFIGITCFSLLVFTYLYTEGGVWNQMARDRQDLSNNFAGPTMRINGELVARGLMAANQNRELTESERKVIQNELDSAFTEYRTGIDIDD